MRKKKSKRFEKGKGHMDPDFLNGNSRNYAFYFPIEDDRLDIAASTDDWLVLAASISDLLDLGALTNDLLDIAALAKMAEFYVLELSPLLTKDADDLLDLATSTSDLLDLEALV